MPKSRKRLRKTTGPVLPSSPPGEIVAEPIAPPELPETPAVDETNGHDYVQTPTAPVQTELPVEGPEPAPALTPRVLINAVTAEVALYGLICMAALFMRLLGLGARPLASHEAANALAAWQLLQGQGTPNGLVDSPLLLNANLLLFMLGGATDTTARVAPALFGSLVVWLPFLLRREIGRLGGLIASALLLLSTSLVYFARDLNGVEVSVVAGFAAGIWLWHYLQDGKARSLYLGAMAAALALTASAAGFTILLSGVVFALVYRLLVRRTSSETHKDENGHSNGSAPRPVSPRQRAEYRNAALLFAAVYVIVSTAFLVNRAGLGEAFNLFGEWLGMFSTVGPLTTPLSLLLIYEPLVLVFGLAGLLLVPNLAGEDLRTRGSLLFLACAAVVGLIIYSVAGDKFPGNVVIIVAPMAILAGWFVGSLLERAFEELAREGNWRSLLWGELPLGLMGLLIAPLVYVQLVMFLQGSRFSQGIEAFHQLIAPNSPSAFEPAALLLGAMVFSVAAMLTLLSIGSIGATRTANLAAVVVMILLGISGIRALWLANYFDADTVHEFLAEDQTALEVRDLVSDLEWQSEWRANDQHAINVSADVTLGPVVQWYLRNFPDVKWVTQPTAGSDVQALVTADTDPAPTGNWISQRYDIQLSWQLTETTRADLFKWLIFRDGGTETWQSVKLWVPAPQ